MGCCFSAENEIQQPENTDAHGVAASPPNNPNIPQASSSNSASNAVTFSRTVEDLRQNPVNSDLDIFTYEEMALATKHFRPDQVLGEGGFGFVYNGVIDGRVRPGYNAMRVAVKVLNREGPQGDREWLAEVNYLGHLRHPNVVRLIGYCCEGDHRILVYEYMASGSLDIHIFPRVSTTLTWSTRMKIALDAAKGLAFLHTAERQIIYRDFKTANILLDADFNAKLSDFGLAREGPVGNKTHVTTRILGTEGYAAPEYLMTGHLTSSCDVYGFGVFLLEMLTGYKAIDSHRPRPYDNLVVYARPILNHRTKFLMILDDRMQGQYSKKVAITVANLAHQCLSQDSEGRPVMSHVVEILEGLQTEGSQEEAMRQSGGGSVTLGELLKRPPESPTEE